MKRRKKRSLLFAVFALLIFLGGFYAYLLSRGPETRARKTETARVQKKTRPSSKEVSGENNGNTRLSAAKSGTGAAPEVLRRLEADADRIKAGLSPEVSFQLLADLRAFLNKAPREEAVRAILAYLDSGDNAFTRLGFGVGRGGNLRRAPSLRVFLLDMLGNLDLEKGAEYAEKVFAAKNSPDEWAVSLRNVGRAGTEGGQPLNAASRSYLVSRIEEMVDQPDWLAEPTAGFLEAFDAIVFVGGEEFIPRLSHLMEPSQPLPLQYASFLALDRLVLEEPVETLRYLSEDSEMLTSRPLTRASLFARADMRDREQRAIVESYLADPGLSEAERKRFLGLFPNHNRMLSNNLLSQNTPWEHDDLLARTEAAQKVVSVWLRETRFASFQPSLEKTAERISELMPEDALAGKN